MAGSNPALKAPFPYFGGKARVAPEVWERFGEVLRTGIMSPGENAAVLLRNHLLNLKSAAAGSGTARQTLYALTESALIAFLAGERVTKLLPAKAELFPIAGDKVAA